MSAFAPEPTSSVANGAPRCVCLERRRPPKSDTLERRVQRRVGGRFRMKRLTRPNRPFAPLTHNRGLAGGVTGSGAEEVMLGDPDSVSPYALSPGLDVSNRASHKLPCQVPGSGAPVVSSTALSLWPADARSKGGDGVFGRGRCISPRHAHARSKWRRCRAVGAEYQVSWNRDNLGQTGAHKATSAPFGAVSPSALKRSLGVTNRARCVIICTRARPGFPRLSSVPVCHLIWRPTGLVAGERMRRHFRPMG